MRKLDQIKLVSVCNPQFKDRFIGYKCLFKLVKKRNSQVKKLQIRKLIIIGFLTECKLEMKLIWCKFKCDIVHNDVIS